MSTFKPELKGPWRDGIKILAYSTLSFGDTELMRPLFPTKLPEDKL